MSALHYIFRISFSLRRWHPWIFLLHPFCSPLPFCNFCIKKRYMCYNCLYKTRVSTLWVLLRVKCTISVPRYHWPLLCLWEPVYYTERHTFLIVDLSVLWTKSIPLIKTHLIIFYLLEICSVTVDSRLGNWSCHFGRATMTPCQADKRNVQREGKKLDIQKEAERSDSITPEKQRKSRLDFWLYTSPLLLPGDLAILVIIRLPQSSWYHLIKLSLGNRTFFRESNFFRVSNFLRESNYWREAGSDLFLCFAANSTWDNKKNYSLLVDSLSALPHPGEGRYFCLHFMGETEPQES